MWKASREDLRVLEKAAAPAVPDESLLMEINGGNGAAAFDDDHHAAPVSKDSSDSGSIVGKHSQESAQRLQSSTQLHNENKTKTLFL